MGKLALTGALSGGGQALQQGLINMQQGLLQRGMQDERLTRWEADNQADRTFQMGKLLEQQAFADRLKQQEYGREIAKDAIAEQRILDPERAAKIGKARAAGISAEAESALTSDEGLSARRAKLKESEYAAGAALRQRQQDEALDHKKREAAIQSPLQAAQATHFSGEDARHAAELSNRIAVANIQAARSLDTKLAPGVAALVEVKMLQLKGAQERLRDDPSKAADVSSEVQEIEQEIRALLGVSPPKQARPAINDPFLRGSPLSPQATPNQVASPAPRGFLQTVSPERPVQPRGSVPAETIARNAQGQLDYDILDMRRAIEQAKIHGTTQRVQYLEKRLSDLLRQKE